MRTVITHQYGGPEVLELAEVPTPEPGPGEVRIAVTAAAVNPVDLSLRSGAFGSVVGEPFPLGFGWDVSGTVDAVGTDVDRTAVGDVVVGLRDAFVGPTGTYASHVVLPATAVAPAPTGVDPVAAATFPLNSLTALQALGLLGLDEGRSIVVTGAAGGLGDYLVSLAARRGLRVIGVARPDDESDVRAAGASDFIAGGDDLAAAVRELLPEGADGLVDAAQISAPALGAVRDGGAFVGVTDGSTPESARDILVSTVHVRHDGVRLAELARGVEEGWLRLRVAETFPLEEVAKAHEVAATAGLRGRVVLTA
jgi:NADPH2:quinone reductase